MKLNNMASRREFLKELSTSELDRMLQAELQKDTIDDDFVRLVLSVLEEREKDYPVELNEEIAMAAEVYENAIMEPQSAPVRKTWSLVLKAASILLVVSTLLFALPQATRAESFFGLLARWTESVFEFFNPTEEQDEQLAYVFKTDHPGLQQTYDTVVEMGVADPVVPMWVPDGYELVECKTIDDKHEKILLSVFSCDTNTITFRISLNFEQNDVDLYKDQTNVVIYEYNEINHYIMYNLERYVATWNSGDAVCSVVVDCQEDILFEILKSIYTTEDD